MSLSNKIALSLALTGILLAPSAVQAFDDNTARDIGFSVQAFSGSFNGISDPASTGLVDSAINIINALLVLAAVTAIAFLIVGGVRYMTAQGDEDAVAQAKNTVIFTIIGIIVILLAAVIANFFVAQIS